MLLPNSLPYKNILILAQKIIMTVLSALERGKLSPPEVGLVNPARFPYGFEAEQ